ncbi:hypothetical protein ISCGN_001603 [Ixodes scapularis]
MAGGTVCSVLHCKNRTLQCKNLSFFRFPRDQIARSIHQTKVDEFVKSVAELSFLNPIFVQPMVLEDDWAGLQRVLNGRVTGIRTLHRSDAVVMRFTSTVDVHSMLEMGPLHGALTVVLAPVRVVGSPFASSPLYHNRRQFSFDVKAVSMNFSAGTDFESGKGRLHALSLKRIIGLNASIDEMDIYGGSIVNLFTYVLKRHAERCVRYVVENVLRSVMADIIRYADLSAEGLLKSFVQMIR